MLALVKTPRIEIAVNGEGAQVALDWLARKFTLTVIAADTKPIEETAFWREMSLNRVGNLLEAARLKARMTQRQLAHTVGIAQNMVSDYETGRRPLARGMAERMAKALGVKVERLL